MSSSSKGYTRLDEEVKTDGRTWEMGFTQGEPSLSLTNSRQHVRGIKSGGT